MGPDLRFSFMYVDYSENAPEFYIGKTRQELDLGSITQRQLDAHDQQLQNREPFFDLRYSRQKSDGSEMFISIDGRPTFSADGEFTGYQSVERDITDLVKTKRKLRSQKNRPRNEPN